MSIVLRYSFIQQIVKYGVVHCSETVNKMGRKKSSRSSQSNVVQPSKKLHYVPEAEPASVPPITISDKKLQRQQEKSKKDDDKPSKELPPATIGDRKLQRQLEKSKKDNDKPSKELPPTTIRNRKVQHQLEDVSKKKTLKNQSKDKPEPNQKNMRKYNESERYKSSSSSQLVEYRNSYREPSPKRSYVDITGKNDPDYKKFLFLLNNNFIETHQIKEIQGDLFEAPNEFALAHCVASDMTMGAGIAKTFRRDFGCVGELLDQHQNPGGLAILNQNNRYIYYLVTKYLSTGKPTLYTLWQSVKALKSHMERHNVRKLAMPKIGCGLDRLEWFQVKAMLAHIFQDSDIRIEVYYLDETTQKGSGLLQKAYMTHYNKELVDEEIGTARIYFGYEDGTQDEDIMKLEERFHILNDYRKQNRLGQIVITESNDVLYGLIVKKDKNDEVHYAILEKCLKDLSKILIKHEYNYVGIPVVRSEGKDVLHRVINLVQYTLYKFYVGFYWPKDLPCPSYLLHK